MIEKMKKEGKLTAPAAAVVEKRWKPSLSLPKPPKSMGDVLLSLESADIGYEGEIPLLKNVNFELRRGTKLILRGPNVSMRCEHSLFFTSTHISHST